MTFVIRSRALRTSRVSGETSRSIFSGATMAGQKKRRKMKDPMTLWRDSGNRSAVISHRWWQNARNMLWVSSILDDAVDLHGCSRRRRTNQIEQSLTHQLQVICIPLDIIVRACFARIKFERALRWLLDERVYKRLQSGSDIIAFRQPAHPHFG